MKKAKKRGSKLASKTKFVSRKSMEKKEKEFTKCLRCNLEFESRNALRAHLKMHSQALREIKLLEEGHIPLESKIGMEFKGKNKIIIS